jgi:AraC-like DNA-binding protein
MTEVVRAASLTNYFLIATHVGLNPQSLLAKYNLTRKLLSDPEQRIPVAAAVGLLEDSARESGCDTFGLRMAELRKLADVGAISLLLTHQPTLRDVVKTITQYQHIMNETLAINIEEAGKQVVLRAEIVADLATPAHQATDLAIGVLFRVCWALLGAKWHPISINFTHGEPPDISVHQRIFRCALAFNADFNGIVCRASDLDFPNPDADPAMARYAARLVDLLPDGALTIAPSIERDVRKSIYVGLPMGRASIEQVAQALGINVRTLQRRLDDSGRTFSDLTNEVRRDLVLRYMENPRYSIGRVAELLGYTVLSSFTRWFAAQFGASPQAWRTKQGIRSAPRDEK